MSRAVDAYIREELDNEIFIETAYDRDDSLIDYLETRDEEIFHESVSYKIFTEGLD